MKALAIVIGVVILAGAGYLVYTNYYTNPTTSPALSPTNTPSSSALKGEGKVIFGITDAAASLDGVSAINVTINRVEVNSVTKGWIIISNASKQYNLLDLKSSGDVALLADAKLAADTYNQIRLNVAEVIVLKNGVRQSAKVPSGEVKMNGSVVVAENATSSVVVDILADLSLHVTGNGKYIFAPVLKLETRSNAQVEIQGNMIVVSGGRTETNVTLGMDANGEVRIGGGISASANIDLTGGGIIQIKTGKETGVKIGADAAANTAKSTGTLDIVITVTLTDMGGKKAWDVTGLKGLILTHAYVDASTGLLVQ